jgi:GNAT superfamily N-acetyltransferase
MIRLCTDSDMNTLYEIINDAARAYEGRIPDDCYHQPYMRRDEILSEMAAGVAFYGHEEDSQLDAVMGIQDRGPVTLIRHAYTRTRRQGQGLGTKLLAYLLGMTAKPVLVGTWCDATWAVRFYQQQGFKLTTPEETERLLRAYWSISDRQIETSVVLVLGDHDQGLASDWE